MSDSSTTCWTVIEGAAAGSREEREAFARRYLPAVRAYLRARWRGAALIQDVDDAVQEVFVECFRSALARTRRDGTASFRGFLFGVARNVARRFEERRAKRREPGVVPSDVPARDGETPSEAFDRAWAQSVLDRARALQEQRAREQDEAALRRVELLRLRHEEDLPIREIARAWDEDPARLHHAYARAREEFAQALMEIVAFDNPGTPAAVRRECAHLVSFFR